MMKEPARLLTLYPTHKKSPLAEAFKYGGGIGIRTLDTLLTYASFQDWCIQPLCHPTLFRSAGILPNLLRR